MLLLIKTWCWWNNITDSWHRLYLVFHRGRCEIPHFFYVFRVFNLKECTRLSYEDAFCSICGSIPVGICLRDLATLSRTSFITFSMSHFTVKLYRIILTCPLDSEEMVCIPFASSDASIGRVSLDSIKTGLALE